MSLMVSLDFHWGRGNKLLDYKKSQNKMKVQLILGQFNEKDAITILTKMIAVKIKFQEEKIERAHNEEDVKMRENRIKSLQKDLYEARQFIEQHGKTVAMESIITLTK